MTDPFLLPTLPSLLAHPGEPFLHRDLSWVQFNERVLSQARSSRNPLLERVRFLGITASTLDEFFQIRFPSLLRSGGTTRLGPAHAGDPQERVRGALLEAVARFHVRKAETFEILGSELVPFGIHLIRGTNAGDPGHPLGASVFEEHVLPALAPLDNFSAAQLRNLENLQLACVFPGGVWLAPPRSLPPIHVVAKGDAIHIFFLDHLLASHLGPALRVEGRPALLRLTRDGDFTVDFHEEDSASIPDRVLSIVKQRERGRMVRLQISPDAPPALLAEALAALHLPRGACFAVRDSLVLHGLKEVPHRMPESRRADPKLFHPPLQAFVPAAVRTPSAILDLLARQDLLLHHPYDSFDAFLNFIRAACDDPAVTRIEQTIYRTDADAAVFEAIKAAAGRKKMRVIIEPRARFDELNNLRLTAELRKAGVEVGFGFGRLKLHAKIALVTRRDPAGERQYTHLSTGNYNTITARQYEDLALLTSHPEIGRDARYFFDSVWAGRIPGRFRLLLSAPASLHRRLTALIETEIQAAREKRPARIFAKLNGLVDETIIRQLYRASQAGVRVDLVVRGACSLIPGVRGLSENIRVIGLVDRWLEHSRIYAFAAAKATYLSSADWMPRNFFSRLEVAFPVLDENLRRYLEEVVIGAYLSDTVKARELTPEGTWKKRTEASLHAAPPPEALAGTRFDDRGMRCQFFFEDLAAKGYRGTPLRRPLSKKEKTEARGPKPE